MLNSPGKSATSEELNSAALQFVRKISGYRKPSRANEEAFERAVQEIAAASERLLTSTSRPPKKVTPSETAVER